MRLTRPGRVARARALAALLALGLAPALALGQDATGAGDRGRLTLERIFADGEFQAEPFGPARWLADGRSYTTLERSEGPAGGRDIVRYDAATGRREVLVPAAWLVPEGSDEPLAIEDYAWSADGRRLLVFTNTARVWRENTRGDYWTLDLETRRLGRLGGDAPPSTLMFAKFSPAGDRVGYVRYDQNDLYVERLADGSLTRLTDDGSRTTINGTFDWVYEEEFHIRDGWRWSPDGERIAYWQLDATGVRDFLLLNTTDSLYSFTVPIQYPKAGTTNSAARVGVVSAAGGSTTWLEVPGDPREHYIARMDWAASSDEVVVQQLNRLQNTLWIRLGDAGSGAVETVHVERDSAWVDLRVGELVWLDGGDAFLWISESDGWRHAHVYGRDGRHLRTVTPGDYDVIDVTGVDVEGGWLYFLASPDDPTRRYLYRARLDREAPAERLTPPIPGTHDYQLAPGAAWAIHVHSAFGTPPTIDLVQLPAHETARVLAANADLAARVEALDRGPSEFFRVDSGEGVPLDGWVMRPPGFDPGLAYPVLFFVYGEPAGQTVRDAWFGATYLWHLLLTQRGYVVVSVDPRGTPAPRGRAWRKSIYRRIGTLTSADIAGAARSILGWPEIDPDRVAIWGWSGGGSQSLNAIFRYPDLFGTAMAVAPVPDIRLYDTIYQERYMGLPQENPDDYAASSPLTHAHRLEGDLLVVHGTGDDNVHYQGTERLVDALVAANKPFTMMAYPNRTHGIHEGQGTTLHLYGLLTRFLTEHVEPGPRPVPAAR